MRKIPRPQLNFLMVRRLLCRTEVMQIGMAAASLFLCDFATALMHLQNFLVSFRCFL